MSINTIKNKYKIAWCDEDINFVQDMKKEITQYNNLFTIDYYNSFPSLSKQIYQYDILITDFKVTGISAYDLYNKINHNAVIKVIISNDSEHIYESFHHGVFQYILKENIKSQFPFFIRDVVKELNIRSDYLCLHAGTTIVHIPRDEIKYMEKNKNYLYVHAKDTYKIRYSFKQLVNKINDTNFIIPMYGTMVNMKYVRYLYLSKGYLLLEDGTVIYVSKSARVNLLEQFLLKKPS